MDEQVLTGLAVAGALAAVSVCGLFLSWRATRLHRLHQRMDRSRAGLGAALHRRRETALRLARALGREHRSDLLTAAVAADGGEHAESALSRALRRTLADPAARRTADTAGLVSAAAAAARGVQLARVFHNAAVADIRRARRSRTVRLFRLAGGVPMPDFFEIDDLPPDASAAVPSSGIR